MTLRRIQAYLYSSRNLAASMLAIGGLALHFVGLVGDPLWIPIVAALYGIGALLVPGERALSLQLNASADTAQLRSGLDRLLKSIRGRVPADIYGRVQSIRDSILLTIPADNEAEASDATDPNVYLIRQTALDYLPAALQTYTSLPGQYADRPITADGRTPHQALLSQLDLMDRKMREVADDIVRHDTDRLLAHGRFLQERFAGSALDLGDGTVPAVTAGAAPTPVPKASEAPATAVAAEPEKVEQERVH